MAAGMALSVTNRYADISGRPTVERFFKTIEIVIDTPDVSIGWIGSVFISCIGSIGNATIKCICVSVSARSGRIYKAGGKLCS